MRVTVRISARLAAGAAIGTAIWLGGMLTPPPAAAQLVEAGEPCNGDADHREHSFPEHGCNLYWNPHYSVEHLNLCSDVALHCAACYDCCEDRRNEKKKCECMIFPQPFRQVCLDEVDEAIDHGCIVVNCRGTFLDGCQE